WVGTVVAPEIEVIPGMALFSIPDPLFHATDGSVTHADCICVNVSERRPITLSSIRQKVVRAAPPLGGDGECQAGLNGAGPGHRVRFTPRLAVVTAEAERVGHSAVDPVDAQQPVVLQPDQRRLTRALAPLELARLIGNHRPHLPFQGVGGQSTRIPGPAVGGRTTAGHTTRATPA